MSNTFLLNLIMAFAFFSCSANNVKLADTKATPETKYLFVRMQTLSEKGIMFGHQDDMAYGHNWKYIYGNSDVKSVCGDYPAIAGWDLGKLEAENLCNLDSVPFENIREYTRMVNRQGGINTFSWHPDNPLTGGNAWDVETPGVVASIIPGGAKHEIYKQWLDRISLFFQSLKDDNGVLIPVIFRPFHEHSGNWFWWGYKHCTTNEYITLWKFTVEYLRDVKNVHNLLYAFSNTDGFANSLEYLERYPGDDCIDLLGFDSYQFANSTNADFSGHIRQKLSIIAQLAAKKNKLVALTETGAEQIPHSKWWTEVLWNALKDSKISYVLTWRNAHNRPEHYYAPFPGQHSEKDFVDFFNFPQTLFLRDISETIVK